MKRDKKIHELQLKVVRLYDELAHFSEQCAFLCDSFAAIPAQQEFIEHEAIEGNEFLLSLAKKKALGNKK